MEVHGHCHRRFDAVREEFECNFAERHELGASFAATVEGEYVVDVWAGHRDADATLPWERDTIVCVYSITKPMTALAALVLFDRGELSFDDRVTKYWPEYGQNGKGSTEVRHLMGHTAGLPGFGEPLTHDELYDWDHVVGMLQRQEPAWPPGEGCAYHAVTQGFLVGEIVRRITGTSLGRFFRDEIATPLAADFHIGLAAEHFGRTGTTIAGGPLPKAMSNYFRRQSTSPGLMPPIANSTGFRQAELPSGNGHGNARSVVRVQTVVANGGAAFGVELLRPSTIAQVFREQGVMNSLGVRHGIGYGLSGLVSRQVPKDAKISFWWGAGGSTVILDHTNRVCLSYVMNRMDMNFTGDTRGASLTRAFYEAL